MRRLLPAGMIVLLLGSCTGSSRSDPPAAASADRSPPTVYVAIGASETAGVGTEDPFREAWPRVLWRTALPQSTVLYNFGIPGATVEQALREELPEALETEPTIATVWLNVNDLLAGVTPRAYASQLRELLSALRRDGRTKVLVANTPELDRLPAYLECRRGVSNSPLCPSGVVPGPRDVEAAVARYNRIIERVANETGAIVVDLHEFGDVPDLHPDWVSSDGFHPSAAGYERVAKAFADALTAN